MSLQASDIICCHFRLSCRDNSGVQPGPLDRFYSRLYLAFPGETENVRGTEYVGYSEFHPGNLIAQLAEIAVFANALHSDWRTNSSDYFVSLYLELTKAHIWSEARSPLKALVGEKVFGAPRILSAFEYRQENLFLIGSNAYTIIADNSVRSSVFGEHEPKIISLEYSEEPVWELQFPV